jgi:hypothetical protein
MNPSLDSLAAHGTCFLRLRSRTENGNVVVQQMVAEWAPQLVDKALDMLE